MRNEGNYEHKYLKLPVSTRRKRRFINWLERSQWTFFDGYDRLIHLPTLRVKATKTLYDELYN